MQLILREVTRWPQYMLDKKKEIEERGEEEETIELLYDEEEYFIMTKLQRLHYDLLCPLRCFICPLRCSICPLRCFVHTLRCFI